VRLESLNPANVPRVRRELLDADYLDTLSPEDYRWYAQFTDEYVSASVHKDDEGNVKPGYLHNTKELAKSVYDANNWRNNDVLSVSKANHLLRPLDMNPEMDNDAEVSNIRDITLTEQYVNHLVDTNMKLDSYTKYDTVMTKDEHDELFINEKDFKRMLKAGTKMPDKMIKFYKDRYKIT
jgi:hypothetical protein